jgi:hypothetical protein
MKSAKRFLTFILIIFFFNVIYSHAQSGISIKYIRDYVSQSQPKIGVVFSYDSVFLEATLKDLSAKGGLGDAMAAGLAVQTVTSRKAFARYEALTAPGIAKINNFANIIHVSQDDQLVRGAYEARVGKANSLMKQQGVSLLVHVIFGGKFMNGTVATKGLEEKEAFFMHGEIGYRFYVNPASGLKPNYLQAPVFNMSYQYGADETHKGWSTEQVQAYMAEKHLAGYAEMLARLKNIFETDAYFDSTPIGIVRNVEDKRITVQTSIPVRGEGGLGRTLETASDVYEGNYGVDAAAFWAVAAPSTFTEGMVVAQIKGDNKSTPHVVETTYQLPVAELIAREGDMGAATCAVRKLPKVFELQDLVGMTVIAAEQAKWYFSNPEVPGDMSALPLDKGKVADESFLKNPPAPVQETPPPSTNVKDEDGIAWPLPAYAGNTLILPATAIKADPSGFALDKVKSVSETVKILEGKGFKIGMVFAPYVSSTGGKGIVRFFSDADTDKFIKEGEKIMGTPTSGDNKAKLASMGLMETAAFPVSGKLLNAGQDIVKELNERYQTTVFELVDPGKLPQGQPKLASKSKLVSAMSSLSGGAMNVVDLTKTQYKLLGNYELKLDKDKNRIESQVNLYHTGAVGLALVGAGFKVSDPKITYSISGTPDAEYDKYLVQQKSGIDNMAEGMWEGKVTTAYTFNYKDKEMLHPPTTINPNAKQNIVPKKEKTLLEKVRRYETEGNKIGIILEPTAVVAEKEKPQTSMVNSAMPVDTVDCVFSAGRVPFSDQFLYLGHKLQKVFNEAFETDIFEVINADVMPTKKGSKLGSVVADIPQGFDTQFKTIITLSIAGSYSIKKAGTSNITVSKAGSSSSNPDSKSGKYEMGLSVLSTFRAEEFNNENNKDKNVARSSFLFSSDRFLTNDCPSGVDDFVTTVGSPDDFFKDFEALLDQNIDKVIKKEMK